MLPLQRAIFLRGVFDPSDPSRITTTLYRPKHLDLRFENGFVRSGDLLVPLDNVVELKSLPVVEPAPAVEPAEPEPAVLTAHENQEPQDSVRRRGRPRKNPS